MGFWDFFETQASPEAQHGTLFAYLKKLAGERSEADLKLMTGYAGVLGKVANADSELAPEELDSIERILIARTGLESDMASDVVKMLRDEKAQLLCVENYFYDRMINDTCNRDQKLALLRAAFDVAAVDGNICVNEERELVQLANMLKIPQAEFVSIKRDYVSFLETLK